MEARFKIIVSYDRDSGQWYAKTSGLAIHEDKTEIEGDGAEYPLGAIGNLYSEIENAWTRFAEFTIFPGTCSLKE